MPFSTTVSRMLLEDPRDLPYTSPVTALRAVWKIAALVSVYLKHE